MKFLIATLISLFLFYPYHLIATYFGSNDPTMVATICSSITASILYIISFVGNIFVAILEAVSDAFGDISFD